MFCNKCGNEINEKSKFCNKCGTKINQSSKKEKKNKKETSKSTRILVIVLLSIIVLYFFIMIIANIRNIGQRISEGNTNFYIGLGIWLIILLLCGYGIIKNILKLMGKDKKFTAEQLQKRKKRNVILGLSSVIAVVLVIVVMFGYGNISESNEKEQMISKIKEYQNTGYFEFSDEEYQELEVSSNSDVKERLNIIENNIKLQKEYNEKYSDKLDEIYSKEIQVELYESEDKNFVYMPYNSNPYKNSQQVKAQVEYVTISKSANQIAEIFYSVEMDLTVYNKYNSQVVSSGVTKKYYKIPYLRDLDKVKKINNYNDKAIGEELMNAIEGKTGVVVAIPSKYKVFKYDFLHVQK